MAVCFESPVFIAPLTRLLKSKSEPYENKELVLSINRKSHSKYYEKNKEKEKERILNNYHWKKISNIFLNILLN
jgi:hypothetical protein